MPANHGLKGLAADVAHVAQQLSAGPVDMIGWSLGGAVLQTLLVSEGREVARRAILLNSFPAYTTLQHRWLDSMLALRGRDDVAATLLEFCWSFTPQLLADHARTMDAVHRSVDQQHPIDHTSYEAQARALRTFDVRPELPSVTTPTMILAGADDILTPLEQSVEMASLIPKSILKILPRGSHGMILEHPKETIQAIVSYLQEPMC